MMRLRSFEISNFRKFDRPVRLEGLGDGINLLAEPNEFGKSTLLAALKAVLFHAHRAKGKAAESMRHVRHATSPVLSLGFELSTGLHHIEKRFLDREPYARLTLPDGTRIEGDAAEERLQAILGFAAPGRNGATPDSVGMWGTFWVAQREAVHQPELPETGRATLHECLETELGTLVDGGGSSQLGAQIKAELSTLIDGLGRPKGRSKEVGEQISTLDTKRAQLERKRLGLEEAIGVLARLRRDLAQATDADADQQLIDDLNDARRRRDAALQHQHVLQGAVASLSLAERSRADAEAETERRSSRRQTIAAARVALEEAGAKEARLLEEQIAAETRLTNRQLAVRAAETTATAAALALKAANAVSALVMRSGQIVRLGAGLERATAAQAEVDQLSGELSANPADAARLQAVTSAAAMVERARSVLDAQATEIAIDLVPDAAERVHVAGSALPVGPTLLRTVQEVALDIAGIGQIRVRPAIRDRSKLESAVNVAEAAMATALLAIGATDPATATNMATARSSIAERLHAAEAALKAETPGDTTIGLKPGLPALRSAVAVGRSQLAAELGTLGLSSLPTLIEANAVLEKAKTDEEAASFAVVEARTALAGPEAEHGRAASTHREAMLSTHHARSVLSALTQEEAGAVAAETDETLAIRLETVRVEFAAKRELAAQIQRDRPADTVESMDARIKRLEGAGRSRSDTVRRLREEIAGLATRIRLDEGEGLDEQIAELERQREDLGLEQAALQRDVAALTLLRDTLAEADREARERYVAPVLRRLTPYLQGLFPGVEVALGDDLQIAKLTRHAGAEDLDRLSDGTVEQVAVLLRLAYADLMLERGKPAMIVLDDALAYSDRHRLELIFDTLTRAAERMQILVLTCRVEAFSRLGGNRLRLVNA